MPLPTLARPFTLFTAMTGILLGGLACTTQVANGVSTGGGGGTGAGGHPECSKNADCAGELQICRRPEGRCVSLQSERCTRVTGTSEDGWKDDGAVIFGYILPTVGPDQSLGRAQEGALVLTLHEIAVKNQLPAPDHVHRRPLVLVGCDDGPDGDQATAATTHLVDIGVPAIIGHSFSGATIQIATDVTMPAGVLLFSPSATNPVISTLPDPDLVWRTALPDPAQTAALIGYLPTLDQAIRARYALSPAGPIKVAVVHNGDTYGASLADALQAKLSFNGATATAQLGGNYRRFDYGSPGAPDPDIPPAIVAFAPHLTFLFGYNESVEVVLKSVEAQWLEPSHRSFFALGDASLFPSLWDEVVTSEDLRTRILGSVARPSNADAHYAAFAISWDASPQAALGPHDTFGVAGAYDILHLLAYSAVAVGADPLTGANLVKYGLRTMTPKAGASLPQLSTGPANMAEVLQHMADRTPIDIAGASGPLDFDAQGDAPSDIQLWCLPKGTGGKVAGPAVDSKIYYDALTQAIVVGGPNPCDLP